MSKHPAWLDNAVFYEIYPQSFCDSNGEGSAYQSSPEDGFS